MFAGAVRYKLVGKTKINEVNLWCAVGKDVDHDIFELYVVVGSMRSVNDSENVNKLLSYGEELFQNLWPSEVLKILIQAAVILRYDVISAYYYSVLSEILKNYYAMVLNVGEPKFMCGILEFVSV